ncbi:arabinogalactan peptide 16-like [Morus notabilis]|uniref:arabinogalactan peptide 16-like n=1 Tax=Morus notabilis TaxID=981085 RepID=UPI000CED37F4|nr:arabinogalactan peptide 16-like [Morus notabilis]
MAFTNASFGLAFAIVAVMYAVVLPPTRADFPAPAPAPTNDGTAIDQGIAYILMLLALVLTYLIH